MDRTDANLSEARADIKAEMARTDSKASLLLAFNGAALAGLWTVATGLKLPMAALVVGGLGAAGLVAAVALLLSAVRPRLGGHDRGSFPYWARLTPEQVLEEMREDRRALRVVVLSQIALTKFARLQRAVDITRGAGALLLVAVGIAVGGAL
ncbi:Pycsar system effector family protein [Streptomyces milbemycinicus]|uniref:Pycsar system effector family protein n=1 Tax=Streptomyces milbemycinicus TaxID=476552 RepID=A0ABW8LHE5_9ACTN